MKKLLSLGLLVLTSAISLAQTPEKVKLEWKLEGDESIAYKTLMHDIDTNEFEFDFGNMFKGTALDTMPSLTKNMFKELQQAYDDIDFVTTLSSKENNAVEIEMKGIDKDKAKKKKFKKKGEIDIQKLMSALKDGVMLRGSVYKSGGIESFWIKNNQKNLIAMFFELPKKELKVGDSWEIGVNLLSTDQNFICDSAYKKNNVSLTEIKVVEGDTIAVVRYDIHEYIVGEFYSPFSGSGTSTMMKMTHEAIAEFSITKGRWLSYDGITSFVSTGMMRSSSKKSFSLIKL